MKPILQALLLSKGILTARAQDKKSPVHTIDPITCALLELLVQRPKQGVIDLPCFSALGFDSLPLSVKALPVTNTGTGLSRHDRLLNLRQEIGDCHLCKLSKGRKNIVFGTGSADARIMF